MRQFRPDRGTLKLNYPALLILVLAAIGFSSLQSTWTLIHEIKYSQRAPGYAPQTLAEQILAHTDAGSTIAMRTYPDCFEPLGTAGHFDQVKKLSWHRLSADQLQDYVLDNDYLAITESFLDPNRSGRLRSLHTSGGAFAEYNNLAQNHFQLLKKIRLPGGGTTLLYKRGTRSIAHIDAE